MLFNMPKITFFLRGNNDKSESFSLYCRVTYNGTKTEFSTGEKLEPGTWDQLSQKAISTRKKEKYIETLIESITYNLKTIALVNELETALDLVDKFKRKRKPLPALTGIIEDYISSVRPKIKPGTIRNHFVKLSNLRAYELELKKEFNSNTFGMVEAERFKEWFMNRSSTTNVDTANRNVLFFKQALQNACRLGIIDTFELIKYKGEKDKVKPATFLTMQDLTILQSANFQSIMLIQIRDLFLFQCYTGLSFGDIWSEWNIKKVKTGTVITGTRKKNGQTFFIPMNEKAIMILERYKNKLPRYCNEVYNRILKEIGAVCGFNKVLTSHVGRKTFATLMDSDGWSRETVASMLGHRSIRTTEIYYLGESTSRIEREMMRRGAS